MTPVKETAIHDGIQKLYSFENGYGASVVRHRYSYGGRDGLWELAVIRFGSDGDYELVYDTPITSDVLGHLSDSEVEDVLRKIAALPIGG